MTVEVAVISGAIAVLGIVAGALFRNSRRSPEKRQSIDNGWALLTGGMERRLEKLEASDAAKDEKLTAQAETIQKLQTADAAKSRTIAALQLAAADHSTTLARMERLLAWFERRVTQLIDHIVDELGGTPPEAEPRPDHRSGDRPDPPA